MAGSKAHGLEDRLHNSGVDDDVPLVRIVKDSVVKPRKPTPPHLMYMSGVDQMLSTIEPSRTILFYRTARDAAAAAESLRAAIASVLVHFYPMAGRLVQQKDGRLAIDCNDKGVQLLLAHCNLPFTELERNSFEIQPVFRKLVSMDHLPQSDSLDDSFASFQVTSFKGGITVGVSVFHSVSDGHSVWTFIRAVSEACRGEPLSVYPIHARTLLKPEVFMMGTIFPDVDVQELTKSEAAPYFGCMEQVRESNPDPESLEQRVIHFSEEMLETLKKACMQSCTSEEAATKPPFYVSSFQALGAYLWKRLTLAWNLEDEDAVDFRVSADVRSRMIPPLTPAFFGNAVVGIPTPCTAGEICHESLGDIAARLRRSIRKGDDRYIKAAIISRERADVRKVALSKVKMVVVRNASGFPVYEAGDLGWGEPEAVRPPWATVEGQFTWYPGRKGKSMDVIMALSDATHDRFFSASLYSSDPLQHFFLFPNSN